MMILYGSIFNVLTCSVCIVCFPKYKTDQFSNAIMSMFICRRYVIISFIGVREGNNGAYTVWLIFFAPWGSDTCAYLAGVSFWKALRWLLF